MLLDFEVPVEWVQFLASLTDAITKTVNIGTPQLFGIVSGISVFVATISVVLYLLVKSGTFERLMQEMQSGVPIDFNIRGIDHLSSVPELYDSLLEASIRLPINITFPTKKGKFVLMRKLLKDDIHNLFEASNGCAIYHESAYEPERLWGWIIETTRNPIENEKCTTCPWKSEHDFLYWSNSLESEQASTMIALVDPVLDKPIGLLRLNNNTPKNLSINIDFIWITPAYQGLKYGHETILLLLQWLFESGYRRITMEADSRHIILKKFIERCGFKLEAILRKHKIIARKNRDTAVYVILNSEWPEEELKLKKYLGLPVKKAHKVAEIDSTNNIAKISRPSIATSGK